MFLPPTIEVRDPLAGRGVEGAEGGDARGGYGPLCFPHEVTPVMIEQYRARA